MRATRRSSRFPRRAFSATRWPLSIDVRATRSFSNGRRPSQPRPRQAHATTWQEEASPLAAPSCRHRRLCLLSWLLRCLRGDRGAPPPVGALPRPPVPAPPARTGCAMAAELACRDASSGTGHQALKSPSSSQHTRAQAPRTQPHGIWKLLHGTPTLIDEAEETRKIEEPLVGRGNLPGCWRGSGDLLKTQPPTNGPAAWPCLHPRR